MEKLSIKLENCYGIKKLEQDFDFSKFKTFSIYAPNGVMKTSFSKVFNDYINSEDSKDQIFKRDTYERKILDHANADIPTENIFIIKSFVDTNYTSDDLSTLLVRSELRQKYEEALKTLEVEKKGLINTLKARTISTDCEKEVKRTFKHLGDNLFEILEHLLPEISENRYKPYPFKYNSVFDNDVVKKFVEKNKDNLRVYHDKYFEILSQSDDFFSTDGSFGTAQASSIAEAVSNDAFFKAGHKISLKNGDPISSSKDLQDLINHQIEKVVNDPDLRKQFDKIDAALRPKNVQPLKDIVESDKSTLLELVDYDEFQKNYWKSHLSQIVTEVKALVEVYSQEKKQIADIIVEANNESDAWKNTISTFKQRFFDLPFEVGIKNTRDSVLGLEKPELKINFIDCGTGEIKEVERNFLSEKILSQGEKRAFYLLNTIFEIQARLLKNKITLFIIDDIADSFDYRNKYAIVEYLKDLSIENNFYSIILTHNFDFFRTVQSRILDTYKWDNSYIAERIGGEIKLVNAGNKNVTSPFESWKSNVNGSEKHLIACIPFVRNLIEYKNGDSDNYKLLTHCLHIKNQNQTIKATCDILIADLEPIFSETLSGVSFTFSDNTKRISEIIEEQANEVKASPNTESVALEDKIVLAIAIRLKAEEYIWSQVTDKSVITRSQTGKLFDRYKKQFKDLPTHEPAIKVLERVNIMTPENIHLNSFMYEPILDMGIDELKNLHTQVVELSVA